MEFFSFFKKIVTSFSSTQLRKKITFVTDVLSQTPILVFSYSPEWACQIRLQDSLNYNILRKIYNDFFVYCQTFMETKN